MCNVIAMPSGKNNLVVLWEAGKLVVKVGSIVSYSSFTLRSRNMPGLGMLPRDTPEHLDMIVL